MSKCRCGHDKTEHSIGNKEYIEGMPDSACYWDDGEEVCECRAYRPAEPKCAECGHEYGVCIEAPDGCSWSHPQTGSDCLCPGYRPAEPDATDEDFKIEPISQHTLKVPVQYKGQAEPLDFTEPDATERARAFRESYDRTLENAKVWMGSHPWAFDVFEQKDGTTETEGEHYTRIMAAFLESETPRIKAEAVREFQRRASAELCPTPDGYVHHVLNKIAKEMEGKNET